MSWSDTFSTGNLLRMCSDTFTSLSSRILSFGSTGTKEPLIRSTQTLHHYVCRYFTITNKLLKIINTHFEESFDLVSPDESKSIKDNCAIVRERMVTVLGVSQRQDKRIRKIIDPALYDKIAFTGVSLEEKAAVIREIHVDTMGVLGNIFLPVVAVHLAKTELESIIPLTEEHNSLSLLSFKLGDLVQSCDHIIKHLCEQESHTMSIGEATQRVEDAITVLKPPCDAYDDIAAEVEAYVHIISQNIITE